jgi:large subunit ribosomal protein L10
VRRISQRSADAIDSEFKTFFRAKACRRNKSAHCVRKGGMKSVKKEDKAQVVATLRDNFERSRLVVLFDYKGMTVSELNDLRREIEKVGEVDLKVVKNTLVRRALEGSDVSDLSEMMLGPNAILFAYDEPVAPTKVLMETAKKVKTIEVKGGALAGQMIGTAQLKALADLPSREQLLATLLATMQAPVSGVVNLLAQIPRGLVNALSEIKDQKEAA